MTPNFWVQNLNISRETTKTKIAWPSTLPRESQTSLISSNCETCKSLQQRALAEPIIFSHIHNTSRFEEIEEPSILFSNCLTLWTDERESFFDSTAIQCQQAKEFFCANPTFCKKEGRNEGRKEGKLENGTRRAQIPRKPLIFPSPNKQTNRQTKNFGLTEVRTLDPSVFSTILLPTEL